MARTLEEGKKMLDNAKNKKKATKLKAAPIPNRTVPPHLRPVKAARPSLPAVLVPASIAPPSTTGPTVIRARSLDKSIKPTKATVFKTKSKDNLPMSAFGFIDICFCVDSTGSMGG